MDFFNILSRQETLELKSYDNLYVVGCGGIGSWITLFAALSGCFRHIRVWDPDRVESTNLNRTPFKMDDIGFLKVDAIAKIIHERRIENFDISTIPNRFDEKVAEYLNIEKSILIDCRDGIFDDIKLYKGQVIKLNYDGLSVTYDGNPKERIVWGQRQGTYNIVPSFVCPAVFIANLAISEICTRDLNKQTKDIVTFEISNIKRRVKHDRSSVTAEHVDSTVQTS